MSDFMAVPSVILPMAQCIPSNNLLYGPLDGIITQLAGGFGGLFVPLVIMVLLLAGVLFVATILTKKASAFLKAMGAVIGAGLGLPLVILIFAAVYTLLNNACSISLL